MNDRCFISPNNLQYNICDNRAQEKLSLELYALFLVFFHLRWGLGDGGRALDPRITLLGNTGQQFLNLGDGPAGAEWPIQVQILLDLALFLVGFARKLATLYLPGFKPLGQVLVQFMMVWQR